MGWAFDEHSKAVINSLNKSLKVEKYETVARPADKNVERDPGNHTRWKHKCEWHNRGNVLDKIATEWAGEENWMRARKRKSTLERSTNSSRLFLA